MQTNEEMIQQLRADGVLKSKRIEAALRAIDRKNFVGELNIHEAYHDYPLSIGYEQTISQPCTVVFMLELLHVKRGHKVLDIGSGSGWTTALLGYLVGNKGSVVGLERVKWLVKFGSAHLTKYNFSHVHIQNAAETELGIPGETFDRILVSASAKILPQELISQLVIKGAMVIPVQNAILKITKTSETDSESFEYRGFAFVPLIH